MSAPITLSTVRKARIMRQAGWSYAKIAKALGVSKNAVRDWCDRGYAERRRAHERARAARRRPKTPPDLSPEYLLERARILREAGLSCAAIATLYRVDYRLPVSAHGVARRLKLGEWRPLGQAFLVSCEHCEQEFPSTRTDVRWCSARCHQRAKKAGKEAVA